MASTLSYFALGVLILTLPVALYFVVRGGWPALWAALVDYNRLYAAESSGRWQPGALADVLAPWTALILVALGGAALAGRRTARQRVRMALVGFLGAAVLAALLSLRPYVHYYYPLLPLLALLAAGSVVGEPSTTASQSAGTNPNRWEKIGRILLLALLVGPPLRATAQAARLSVRAQSLALYPTDGPAFADAAAVAAWLQRTTAPDAPVWVWASEPQIYLLAGRRAATRFPYDYPLGFLPAARTEVVRQLQAQSPAAIVTYAGVRPVGWDYVAAHYGAPQRIGAFDVFERR